MRNQIKERQFEERAHDMDDVGILRTSFVCLGRFKRVVVTEETSGSTSISCYLIPPRRRNPQPGTNHPSEMN